MPFNIAAIAHPLEKIIIFSTPTPKHVGEPIYLSVCGRGQSYYSTFGNIPTFIRTIEPNPTQVGGQMNWLGKKIRGNIMTNKCQMISNVTVRVNCHFFVCHIFSALVKYSYYEGEMLNVCVVNS